MLGILQYEVPCSSSCGACAINLLIFEANARHKQRYILSWC